MEEIISLSLKRCNSKIRLCIIMSAIIICLLISLSYVLDIGVVLIAIPIILFVCFKKLKIYKKAKITLLISLVDTKYLL